MNETKEQMYEEAKRRMEGFEYKLECGSDTAEIWTCKKPNDSNYAFQLAAGRFGMAMFGDAGALTFGVGTYYGIEFLQNQDKHYVYGKLEHSSKEKEFDEDYWKKLCVEWVTDAIVKRFDGGETDFDATELGECVESGNYKTFGDIKSIVRNTYMVTDVMSDAHEFWCSLDDFIHEAANVSDAWSAYDLVRANEESLGYIDFDYDLEKPSYCTMMRLWMLHVASENIMRIKNAK